MSANADVTPQRRIPHATIIRPYAARGARLWVVVRLMIVTLTLLEGREPVREAVRWTLGGAMGVLACCTALAFVDVRVRRERAFLGNLGVGDRDVVLLYLAPAPIGEILLALIAA